MSILKKGLKYLNPVKAFKATTKFVKKHWKAIVIAALVVFTMGIATVGIAGFTGAMGAAGGGFGGFMSAVGSTMYAGVTAAAGTLGLGAGASGTAATYGGVQGAGLFSGHLAAALGSKAAAAGIAAQTAALPGAAGSALMGPPISLAGGSAPLVHATGTALPAVNGSATLAAIPETTGPAAAGGGLFGGDMAKAALVTTAGNAISGWAAGKASEEEDPKGFWGVDLSGKGEDMFYSPPSQNQQATAAQAPQVPQAPPGQGQSYASANAPQLTPQQIQLLQSKGLMQAYAPPQQQGVYG